MDQAKPAPKGSASPPSCSPSNYPMKELADKLHMPNIKASFGLVKGLSAMPVDGKIVEKMTGLRIIVFPSIFTLSIWSTFHEILGKKLASKVITSFHRDTGKVMVEVGKHAFKLEDKYAFEFYFWLVSAIGWGEIKKFELDAEKAEGLWQLEYKGCLPKNTLKGIPLHDNYRGEIMAAAEEAFHAPVDVKETKCMALGDPYCEFTWKKAQVHDKELASISEGAINETSKAGTSAPLGELDLKNDFKDAFNRVAMPEEGKMMDGDLLIAVKDARSIVGLTYHASDLLGEGTVRAVLVRTGSLFASDDVKRFTTGGKQLADDYLRWLSVTGWGMFHVVKLDENGGEITCERSVFAEQYPRGEKKVCYLTTGIISALLERAFNHRFLVHETECIAKGDPMCRFEIRKMPK